MPSKDKKASSKKNDPAVMQPGNQFPGAAQFNQFPQYGGFAAGGGYPFFGSCQNAMPGYPGFPPAQPTQQPFQAPPQQPPQAQFPNQSFYPAYPPYPGYYHH